MRCFSCDPAVKELLHDSILEALAKLAAAGTLLGIEVLDHIIVGDGRYVSFREIGHL